MRVIHYLPVAFITLALVGCTRADKPEPAIRTVEVKVPVRTPCKPPTIPEPDYATGSLELGTDIFTMVRALLVEREQRKAEAAELRGAIASCG